METYLKGFLVPPGWCTCRQLPWTSENTPEVSEQVGESQGAGARRQGLNTSRAGNFQRALAVCHVPMAQETLQQADAAMEISGLQFPTTPFTSFRSKPRKPLSIFFPERLCVSRFRTRPARELSQEDSGSLWGTFFS